MTRILELIGKKAPLSWYWAVLNPVDMDDLPETGTGDLIDDLGDIYNDLKEALTLFNRSNAGAKEHAVWQFKFDHENHWGEHCINALHVIHHYLYKNR